MMAILTNENEDITPNQPLIETANTIELMVSLSTEISKTVLLVGTGSSVNANKKDPDMFTDILHQVAFERVRINLGL